jgi:hypothetical protein
VPLICFEWLQRPENVLCGHLNWSDYCPDDLEFPHVKVVHHKTLERVEMPLRWSTSSSDQPWGDQLFPELTSYLDGLERLGTPIVLSAPKRKTRIALTNAMEPHLFLLRDARARVRKAARKAGLPEYLTLDACRHGGMTELAETELTEEQEMSLSGHRTPEAKRRYVNKTAKLRQLAAERRRRGILEVSKRAS